MVLSSATFYPSLYFQTIVFDHAHYALCSITCKHYFSYTRPAVMPVMYLYAFLLHTLYTTVFLSKHTLLF